MRIIPHFKKERNKKLYFDKVLYKLRPSLTLECVYVKIFVFLKCFDGVTNMYEDFARAYDKLTDDVNYKERTEYLLRLFKKFDRAPSLLLDLACGTGGFSTEFAKQGVSVIGVDISEEMLLEAREKLEGEDILYLCQDARELDLYGTVDGAVCCLDSLNHLTDYDDFCATLQRVSLFLERDRLFIFDLNTEYKHREILGNNTFVIEKDDIYCVWQNEYDDSKKTVDITLDFFCEGEDGLYERLGDNITERAYTDNEINLALQGAGLKIEAIFEEMSEDAPKNDTQRIIYLTRKAE